MRHGKIVVLSADDAKPALNLNDTIPTMDARQAGRETGQVLVPASSGKAEETTT